MCQLRLENSWCKSPSNCKLSTSVICICLYVICICPDNAWVHSLPILLVYVHCPALTCPPGIFQTFQHVFFLGNFPSGPYAELILLWLLLVRQLLAGTSHAIPQNRTHHLHTSLWDMCFIECDIVKVCTQDHA